MVVRGVVGVTSTRPASPRRRYGQDAPATQQKMIVNIPISLDCPTLIGRGMCDPRGSPAFPPLFQISGTEGQSAGACQRTGGPAFSSIGTGSSAPPRWSSRISRYQQLTVLERVEQELVDEG